MLPGWRVGGFSCWPGRVYVACAPGLALRWPAGVCVCAYGFRVCLVCGICCHWEKSPAIPGPDRRAIGAAWWSWCRVDRWPGLLPVLAAWCCRSCGWVCAYSPGGDAGGHYGGGFGAAVCCGSFAGQPGKARKFYRKIPQKTPTKKFFKKFPPMGERSAPGIFLQKGG